MQGQLREPPYGPILAADPDVAVRYLLLRRRES